MKEHRNIDRKEFLMQMGFKGSALIAILTGGCVADEDSFVAAKTIDADTTSTTTTTTNTSTTAPKTVTSLQMTSAELAAIKNKKLTIDLTKATSANLKKVGGYIISSGIVVALVEAGRYGACTLTCSHEPEQKLTFRSNEWYCTKHGARFNQDGKGLNTLGKKGLAVYNVATDGTTLIVY